MITVSSTTKNTGRYAMLHKNSIFFCIPVNFAFNLPHYVTSYIHHTVKREVTKKKKKNKARENLLQEHSNPDSPNHLELQVKNPEL